MPRKKVLGMDGGAEFASWAGTMTFQPIAISSENEEALSKLRALFREARKEARFVGGLDDRKMTSFYLIDLKKAEQIFGGHP
jgi:hypothetical protein